MSKLIYIEVSDRRSPVRNATTLVDPTADALYMSVKILSTVETSCITNPQQIELTATTRHCRIGRQEARLSSMTTTSFVDNEIDFRRRNCLSPEFGTKFQRKVPLF